MSTANTGWSQKHTYALFAFSIILAAAFTAYFLYETSSGHLPLEPVKITTQASVLTVDLPCPVAPDPDFTLPANILPFVYSTSAFKGETSGLTLDIRAVTYKKELFLPSWRPNLEDMADVTIGALKNTPDIKNLVQEKQYHTISGGSTVEVRSRYMKNETAMTQRVLHLADLNTAWTFKTVYSYSDNTAANTVDKMFFSIKTQKI